MTKKTLGEAIEENSDDQSNPAVHNDAPDEAKKAQDKANAEARLKAIADQEAAIQAFRDAEKKVRETADEYGRVQQQLDAMERDKKQAVADRDGALEKLLKAVAAAGDAE